MEYLNKEQMFELIEQQSPTEEFKSKWGHIQRYHVVKDNVDYLVDVDFHFTEGIQDDTFALVKAKKVETVVVNWVPL